MATIPLEKPPDRIGGDSDAPIHIVLVHPEIPPNTGNVARLAAATGSWLHLVEPMGFQLDHSRLKRAGLDYWPNVKLSLYSRIEDLLSILNREHAYFFSKFATSPYTDSHYKPGSVLIFGCETKGLSREIRTEFEDRLVKIPISQNVRSLNLSNAVSIAVYEVVRQNNLLSSDQ